ncbi:MAG TPA: RnfABCDGE type electron transport complex subunit D [Herpetosiphonaceae bacterium]
MSQGSQDPRLTALRRFAIAITVLNILGHTFFGFEQSVAQPISALATAYTLEILFEWLDARLNRRAPRFLGGPRTLVDFLLSAHITALAVAMLIYTNARIWPTVFATAVAIGSKVVFRVRVGESTRHFFNPSNFGITITLLAFPWVGIAPPYHFTENLTGIGDWLLPTVIIVSGSFLNIRLTRKLPLILAWLGGFAAQALIRNLFFGTPVVAGLVPMTGVAFILFTFYMITDPGTTPFDRRGQIGFGLSVALVYGILLIFNIVFGLFFALTIVCTLRGLQLYLRSLSARRAQPEIMVATPRAVSREA